MIHPFQTVSSDETWMESSVELPLRYLYRGGLKQSGACSSLTAPEREDERGGGITKPIKQWSTVSVDF